MATAHPKRVSDQLRDLKVGGRTGYIEIETVVDTSAYVSGDVLFPTTAIPLALDEAFGTGIIHSIILLDKKGCWVTNAKDNSVKESPKSAAISLYLLVASRVFSLL
jgi:hypothetical protein